MKTEWKLVYGWKWLPMRRELKPIGRIRLLSGIELSAEETKAYCKALQTLKK